jgi:hypothetical protein
MAITFTTRSQGEIIKPSDDNNNPGSYYLWHLKFLIEKLEKQTSDSDRYGALITFRKSILECPKLENTFSNGYDGPFCSMLMKKPLPKTEEFIQFIAGVSLPDVGYINMSSGKTDQEEEVGRTQSPSLK